MVGFGKERLHRGGGGGGGKGECVVLSLHLLFPSLSSAEKNPGVPPLSLSILPLFLSERERDGQRSSDHGAPPPPAKQHSPPLVPPRSIYEARQKFASSSAYPPFAVSSYLTPQGGREGDGRMDDQRCFLDTLVVFFSSLLPSLSLSKRRRERVNLHQSCTQTYTYGNLHGQKATLSQFTPPYSTCWMDSTNVLKGRPR